MAESTTVISEKCSSVKSSLLTSVTNGLKSNKTKKAPKIKTEKVFNDFNLKVLHKYPKEYLRNNDITKFINILEEVQNELSLSYFSHDQITAIQNFINKKTPNNLGIGVAKNLSAMM